MNCCNPCPPDQPVLSLERWRELMCCIDPWAFWQWRIPNPSAQQPSTRNQTACDPLTREHQYHTRNLGRTEIRKGIARAEQIIYNQLNRSPFPTYRKALIPLWNPLEVASCAIANSNFGRQKPLAFKLPERNILDIVRPKYTSLGNATVTYSSLFSGGAFDTFEVKINPGRIVENIEIYFAKTNRWDVSRDLQSWKIGSISWSQDPTTFEITINGRGWLMATPLLYETQTGGIDPTNLANFVTSVEVYELSNDTVRNGKLIYEDKPCVCGADKCPACIDATFCYVNGLARLLAIPDDLATTCTCTCRKVISVCVDYYAGDCNYDWSKIVAELAVAEMGDCCICSCDYPCLTALRAMLNTRNKDLVISMEMLNNPLGLRLGQYLAWQAIQLNSEKDQVSRW